ncbi:MAG: hypothetical protein U9Q79_12470, partial [Candidatus Hydrogenedentes bacterium]|nr:hypothetical protein [Candidatus Hydrogenedentota bacterium]
MSVPDTYLQLRGQLDEVRQRWRGRNLLTGTLLALAFVFVTIVAVVAIDNLVKPETFGRFLLAGLLWTVIAATLYRYVVQPLRQTRCDDFFGAMVERKHAELGNYLINALQLGRGDPYGSPQVVAAIVDDAARVTADVDVVDCLDSKQLKRAAIYAGVAGLFILAYAGALTPWFTNGLRRAVFPTAEIAPYTATRIISVSVEPGDTVPAGVDVSFQAEIAGHIPRQVILARKSSTDEKWLESSMNAEVTQKRTYQYSLEQV